MPPPDPIPDFSRTMRLFGANVVIGFVAGPLLLVALVGTTTYLYDSSPVSLRRIFRMAESFLIYLGYRWVFISLLFCALVWLPLWLTQAFHPIFKKWTYAVFAGMILGLIAFALFDGLMTAFAGAISGIGIFLLSHFFRERADLPHPSTPADDETIID